MEIQTIQKYLHTTPRKLRLVADMVRKMGPVKAVEVLGVTPKAAATDLGKAIKTVLANAKHQGADVSKLTFKTIEVNESMKMRRFRAGTRGRVKPYKKRMSHIKIVLSDEAGVLVDQSVSELVKSAKLPTSQLADVPILPETSEKVKRVKKEKK